MIKPLLSNYFSIRYKSLTRSDRIGALKPFYGDMFTAANQMNGDSTDNKSCEVSRTSKQNKKRITSKRQNK
jgi:hypothetical protein